MRIYLQTLGCKVNQYETQAMERILLERGHELAPEPAGCDVCVVNTCAVTAESGRKSRQAVRRLRGLCPDAVIAVCGCYSQISPEDAAALGADLVAGSGGRAAFLDALERTAADRAPQVLVDNALRRRTFEVLPAGNLAGRTRAMLKIQDGCSNFCAYCIIPYARGPVRSLPLEDAAAEAERLGAAGYREIVVTGIEIASYGRDLPGKPTLADAVCAVADAAPGVRIRLGSLEPRVVTEDFCRRLSALPTLCPHFHLSLQSGCDATLERMRRRYDTARFYESVSLLRARFPNCGLTADLIVGFPGETEAEFEATLAFLRRCAFSAMHIFPYSRRPGTPADKMPDQRTAAEKHDRARRAAAAAAECGAAFLRAQIGKTLSVLFEQEADGVSRGHAGNYCEVCTPGTGLRNTVRRVRITGTDGALLTGVPEDEEGAC